MSLLLLVALLAQGPPDDLGTPADETIPTELRETPQVDEVIPPTKVEWLLNYEPGKGITFAPNNLSAMPFDFRLNAWFQTRYVNFNPTEASWKNRAGVKKAVNPQNYFEIERTRFSATGHIGDEKLTYLVIFDGDSDDDGDGMKLLDYYLAYEFDRAFTLHAGKFRMPGSREWITLARDLQDQLDRSMATTLFRPDRSVGIWATGQIDTLHYRTMIGDGFNTPQFRPSQLDDLFAYSESMWWEPLGDFGTSTIDFEQREKAAIRLGHSYTFAPTRTFSKTPSTEAESIRLTDGSLLTDPDILGKKSQVTAFDIHVLSVDAGVKYRGSHAQFEYFLRSIENIRGTGNLARGSIMETGYFINVGTFVLPKRLEVSARLSQAFGIKTATVASGAINLFPFRSVNQRLTFGLDWLDHNPVSNSGANYRAGDSGWQFNVQFMAGF